MTPAAPPPGSLEGVVTDSVTNQPLQNAQVTVFNAGNNIIAPTQTTDAKGAYSMIGTLESCTDSVQVSAAGYVSTTQQVVINANQTTTLNVALTHQ